MNLCNICSKLPFKLLRRNPKNGILCNMCLDNYKKELSRTGSKIIYLSLPKDELKRRRRLSEKKIYLKNKSKRNEESKKYYLKNKEKLIIESKLYIKKNRVKLNLQKVKRRQSDPLFKLSWNLRVRTRMAFKNKKWHKGGGTEKLLGTSFKISKQHIEEKFTKGMSWENYGKWHIDHIVPLASAKTEEELRLLCHYTNLQPLWAIDNIKKGKKILVAKNTIICFLLQNYLLILNIVFRYTSLFCKFNELVMSVR